MGPNGDTSYACIQVLNRGYIEPTDCRPTVGDANRPIVGRHSVDFVCAFSCFLESANCKKYNLPVIMCVFSICRLSLGFGNRFGVGGPSVDYRSIIGRRSADSRLTFICKICPSSLTDCQPNTGRQSVE